MAIGYVTDIHLGSGVEGDTLALLDRIADGFEGRGVGTVVLLGDIASGESETVVRDRLRDVRAAFEGCDIYATAGNADRSAVLTGVFDRGPNAVVGETESTATVLVDTAAPSEHHAGRIDPEGLELVASQLDAGRDVTVATHYPLQRTEHLPPLFATKPEFAYPDNKGRLVRTVRAADGALERVICGHLHPNARLRVRGEPLGVEMDVLEPVVRVESVYGDAVERSLNERIRVDDLVYEG